MRPLLVVGHGNVHATNRNTRAMLEVIRGSGAASFGLNEAQHVLPKLSRKLRREWSVTVAPAAGRARETPILTRSSRPPLGEGAQLVSAPADPARWAPARWMTWTAYEHPIGPVAHVNVHLNAQVNEDVAPEVARAREYVRSLEAVAQVIRMLKRTGHLVVVTGDINLTASHEARVPLERRPRRMLRLHDMQVVGRGVDVIAAPSSCRVALDLIPAARVGSDHPWLVAAITQRP